MVLNSTVGVIHKTYYQQLVKTPMAESVILDLEKMADRIAKIEAIEEIKALKARYLRACDNKSPDEVKETLYPHEALIHYEGFPAFYNREDFVQVFDEMGCQPHVHDYHHASNADIELIDERRATGKWSLTFKNINMDARTITQMSVEYEDEYLNEEGRWWISKTTTYRKTIVVTHVDTDGTVKIVNMGKPEDNFGE